MKQKRKVKSLLPQKNDWRSSFLTAVLLILSVALCIGSASLITSRVWAEEIHELTYTGLDDKQEVLYGMRFVDRNNMETTVNKMYMKNNSLYITPNPVVVNELSVGSTNFSDSNQVEGVYGHVLGGKGNKVKSKNVTLIAGEDNVVTEGNDNAAFLGGQSNKNFGSMREGGTPMVVVGGANNSIGNNHDGVALIGGNGNKIRDNVSDSFILGGEENEIGTGKTNVIVGGKKVKVRTVNNVFVYSNKGDGTNPNDEFEPKSSDSFYLNVENGVGINTNPSNRGLAVGGVVNLGEIDIKSVKCDQFNFGVEFSYGGCVVGCTKAGAAVNKWEMLDRGAHCQAVCGGAQDYCIYTGEVIEPIPSYDAFCTSAKTNKDIFTGHSHMCYTGELGEYQNVVYETSLIDSDKECPEKNENKCVYQCDQGYHLTGNFAGNDGDTVRCYQDCLYAWEDVGVKKYKHNETVIGYNVNIVACSNNVYMFPFETEIIPAGTRTREGLSALIPAGISIGNKVINGRTYNNRATNGYSPETCGNYDHKKTLVCNNGTMYLVKNDGKKATNMKARDYGYKYKECDTANYRCDLNEYHLTKTDITKSFTDEGLQDSGNGWNNKKDREQFSLTRGQYKLCLDYNRVEGNNETCEIVDKLSATKLAHDEHYKFMGCNEHYTEYPEGSEHCMESCSVTLNGGNYTDIPHGQTRDFYKSNEETCLDRCEWATFKCDDGKWIQSGTNQVRDETSPYQYYGCTQKDKLCDRAVYNVSQKEHDDHISTSLYEESCDEYDGKQRNICDFTLTVYRLTGCKPGYHTENGKWCVDNVKDMACGSKPSNSHWVRTSALTSYPYSNIITKYKTYLNAGWYLVWWDENCAWNGPISSCWVYEYPDGNTDGKVIPGNACEWKCDTGYRRDGSICRKIDTSCQYPENSQNACVNTEPYACRDSEHTNIENARLDSDGVTWRWDCVNGIESDRKSCMICKDGYHISGNKCEKNNDGECNNNLDPNGSDVYKCLNGYARNRSDEEDTRYTWDCLGTPSNHTYSDRKPGPDCTAADDDIGCYKCKQGYHKTSTYGECLINECSSTNRPSGDGVIYGEGTPDTHNKSWSYVSSSYLGACQWTCDESEGYERYGNGCRLKTYTITYNGNGGTPERSSDTVTHGDSVYLPGAERACHDFDGWNGTMGEGYYYGPVESDVTLTAQWTANTYLITYDCNGGSGNPGSQRVTYGTPANVKSSGCTKSNYHFVGWSTNSSATTPTWALGAQMNGVLTNSCENRTLYAVYEENDKCVISFDSDGGSAVASQSLYCGNAGTEPTDPTKTCYTFDKWVTPKTSTTAYDWSKAVNSDITLYAKWTAKQYTITYNCNGGSGNPGTQSVTYGTTAYVKDGGCSKQDNNLVGWSTNSSATTPTWALGAQMNGVLTDGCMDRTLYAVYSKLKNGVCDESEPYGCMNDDPAVEKGEITSSAGDVIGVNWYCQGADGKSPQCKYECDDGETFDTINNVCVDNSDYDRRCVGVCEGSSSTTTQENYCVGLTSYQCNLDPSCVWEFGTCGHKIWGSNRIPSMSTAACDDKNETECKKASYCSWSEIPVCLDVSNQSCVNAASQGRFNISLDCMDETLSECSGRAPSCGDDQKKTCNDLGGYYTSNPSTEGCVAKVEGLDVIGGTCYINGCPHIGITYKDQYGLSTSDVFKLECEGSSNGSLSIGPLYRGYCNLPTTTNPVVDYCKDKGAGVFHDASNGLIYITNGSSQCYKLQDKNVGASSPNSCGNYFQWGNNHPFGTNGVATNTDCTTCLNPWGSSSANFLWSTTSFRVAPTNSYRLYNNKQGPCDPGFFIPSLEDFNRISALYKQLQNSGKAGNWSDDIMVPSCGILVGYSEGGGSMKYRVEDPYGDGKDLRLRDNGNEGNGSISDTALVIDSIGIIGVNEPKQNGTQIRCMKN